MEKATRATAKTKTRANMSGDARSSVVMMRLSRFVSLANCAAEWRGGTWGVDVRASERACEGISKHTCVHMRNLKSVAPRA